MTSGVFSPDSPVLIHLVCITIICALCDVTVCVRRLVWTEPVQLHLVLRHPEESPGKLCTQGESGPGDGGGLRGVTLTKLIVIVCWRHFFSIKSTN